MAKPGFYEPNCRPSLRGRVFGVLVMLAGVFGLMFAAEPQADASWWAIAVWVAVSLLLMKIGYVWYVYSGGKDFLDQPWRSR